MSTADEWVTAALTDDAVVVELLFRLKQSSPPSSSSSPPLLRWGHRQPRSKPPPPAAAATDTSKKEEQRYESNNRCSPTTPLSWSHGVSGGDFSPAGDGSDESSRPSDRSSPSRSDKGNLNDSIGTSTNNKRSRKKKTFAELRDEENLLLEERIHLKKEISTVRVTFKEQKARSENFKRIKLEPHVDSAMKITRNSSRLTFSEACALANPVPASPTTMHQDFPPVDSCKTEKEIETTGRCFVLPDLNMMPSEEDSRCESLYGLR